ncbi:MAG TPA: hypothetical protein PK467_18030, partial [Candidatus Wallbacteria bacterium]|nr:hypothetical protein [Candidatus Wallbacteria bacterium]
DLNLTNNGDFTYTGVFDWNAYANVHNGVWQIKFDLRDSSGKIYNPTKIINITGTNVATQSSIMSLNSNLSTADFGVSRSSSIYYKIQSNIVDSTLITAQTAKLYCAANWYDAGGTHYYELPDLQNNLDGTYQGGCNLNALSPLCHYGMWILNLKIQDSYPQTYEVAKEIFLFSSSSSLRAIVSKNPYFGSTYDIKSDGTRSDSSTAAPRFNSNGTVYLVFNAAPPNAATKVNYSSVTANTFKLQFSEYSNFPTGNYRTNSSVPVAKRGLPKVVTTADFMLANNGNGLFTAEIALDSAGITSVRRAAWDKYFRIVMTVRDTANVTASITTRAHEIDNTNSQTPDYVDLHSPFINPVAPSKDYLTPVYAALKALSTQAYIKSRNFMELARKPVFTENLTARSMFGKTASSMAFGFKDAEMRNDISLLSTPQGREVYFKNRVNNAFTNYACDYTLQKSLEKKAASKHGSGCCTKNRSVPAKNVSPVKAGDGLADRAFRSLFMPSEAVAAAYGGKYAVVHKIRDWIIGGGYM